METKLNIEKSILNESNEIMNEMTINELSTINEKLILDLCKLLNIDKLNIDLNKLKNTVSSSYDILTNSNKRVIDKLINSVSSDINKYIEEIFKDGKLDFNDLEPLCGLIKYLVNNFNKVKEIKNIEPEIVIILIKLIVILIIQKFGNIEDYLQIINLAFTCLKMVIGYTGVEKCCFFLCK